MTTYLAVGSPSGSRSRSGSHSGSRSNSRSRSRSRSVSAEVRTDILQNLRVVEQSSPDPFEISLIRPQSRYFRIIAFAMHFGISMLESPDGRNAVVETGRDLWRFWGRRDKRNFVYQGGSEGMRDAVDDFLARVRSNPPNVIVSNRVEGEGMTKRVAWADFLDSKFDAKWAALFRLNKTVIDDALIAADDGDVEEFQHFLFLLGITAAHELIHLFVGYLTGRHEPDTPAEVQYPPRSVTTGKVLTGGESGNTWEGRLMDCVIVAYYNPGHPRRRHQAGDLYAMQNRQTPHRLEPEFIRACLQLDFRLPPRLLSRYEGKSVRLVNGACPMVDVRPFGNFQDLAGDLTEFFKVVNNLPIERIGSRELNHIMSMCRRPERVRQNA
ncbi:hypothetical protein OQA88_8634 [Cercophora sp. LCS_1]